MLQAVAYDEIIDVEQHVVDRYLVEHTLRKGNGRSLVFYYHNGLCLAVIQHTVAPQALVANAKLYFVGEQRRRIALVFDKEMDEMLSHPFFGSKAYVLSSERVEDERLAVPFRDFYFVLW